MAPSLGFHAPLVLSTWLAALMAAAPAAAGSSTNVTWGPYRPNLFLGIRPQVPESVLMGLMWGNGTKGKDELLGSLRSSVDDDEGLGDYGWQYYDTRRGGRQEIRDSSNGVTIQTDFFRMDDDEAADWGVRIRGSPPVSASARPKTAVVFDVAMELMGDKEAARLRREDGSDYPRYLRCDVARCAGKHPALGLFEMRFHAREAKAVAGPAVRSLSVDEDKIWQANAVYRDELSKSSRGGLVMDGAGDGNMHFWQAVFEGAFSLDILFYSNRLKPGEDEPSVDVNKKMESVKSTFRSNFDAAFPMQKQYQNEDRTLFAHKSLSNLFGGLGYFHGDRKVDLSEEVEYMESMENFWEMRDQKMKEAEITTMRNASLLTHTPARKGFARGFLWDEGFHLLPLIDWDLDLAAEVMLSWLRLMDPEGWIAREQMLGDEARSGVPGEFVTQYPRYANPPTFIALTMPKFLEKLGTPGRYKGSRSAYLDAPDQLLKELYALLKRHYSWWRVSQGGSLNIFDRPEGVASLEGYRWRGRTPTHCLTSGLDDYPRPQPPHPGELHADALAWVGGMARAMMYVAAGLHQDEDQQMFREHLGNITSNLDVLHWSEKEGVYCDATVDEDGRFAHDCHVGYASVMPLFSGILEESSMHDKIARLLAVLEDEQKLWSPHGLRSLSRSDPGYMGGDGYWTGPVWVNFNVLAVKRLVELANQGGPNRAKALALAGRLRSAVVDTVHESMRGTGFLWEQYSDEDGRPRGHKGFTGWTSTVVQLMSLEIPDADEPADSSESEIEPPVAPSRPTEEEEEGEGEGEEEETPAVGTGDETTDAGVPGGAGGDDDDEEEDDDQEGSKQEPQEPQEPEQPAWGDKEKSQKPADQGTETETETETSIPKPAPWADAGEAEWLTTKNLAFLSVAMLLGWFMRRRLVGLAKAVWMRATGQKKRRQPALEYELY